MMLQYSWSFHDLNHALSTHSLYESWEATQRGNECEGVDIHSRVEKREKSLQKYLCNLLWASHIYNLEAVQTIFTYGICDVKRLSMKIFMWKVMECIKTNDDIKLCHTKPILLPLSSLCAFVQVSVRSTLPSSIRLLPSSLNSFPLIHIRWSTILIFTHPHIHTLASHTNSFNVLLLCAYIERRVEMNLLSNNMTSWIIITEIKTKAAHSANMCGSFK